jgi:hypothetical protein
VQPDLHVDLRDGAQPAAFRAPAPSSRSAYAQHLAGPMLNGYGSPGPANGTVDPSAGPWPHSAINGHGNDGGGDPGEVNGSPISDTDTPRPRGRRSAPPREG